MYDGAGYEDTAEEEDNVSQLDRLGQNTVPLQPQPAAAANQ